MTSLTKASLVLGLGLFAFMPVSGASAADVCLHVRDIQSAQPDNPMSMTVRTISGNFLVKFTSSCPAYMQHTHFVIEPEHLGECLKAHDALTTNEHVACFIESVKPL